MKKSLRIAAVAFACVLTSLEVSSILAKKPPPPPVLCGCACPDGSIIVTHAPSADQCDEVCAHVCDNTM
jgi:hypothetical protein